MGNHHSIKRECLHEAIIRKDVKKVKQIIYNSDIDFIKNDFKSLELATLNNLTEVVELLLSRGCVPRDKRTARAFDLGKLSYLIIFVSCCFFFFVLFSSRLEMS